MLTIFFNVVYETVKVEFLFFGLPILYLTVESCTVAIELPLTSVRAKTKSNEFFHTDKTGKR